MATWSRNDAMTTEPIAALLSGEPQPPSRADDAAQDQLSPLDAVAEAPGLKLFKKGSGGGKVWRNMGASAKFHAVERKLSEIDIEQEAPQGGGRRWVLGLVEFVRGSLKFVLVRHVHVQIVLPGVSCQY